MAYVSKKLFRTHSLLGKSGELCQLTPHTFAKISEYCQKWVNLDGEQSKIAANVAEFMKHWSLDSENELVPEEIANARYHKECYVRFCDKTKIERAEKRMKKKEMTVEASSHGEPSTPVINRPAPAPVRISPRTLISGSEAIPRRNRHVLPERCIICKRQDAYKVDKVTRKRKLDKLVLAETFNGGLLREAAEKKKDESILAHIRGKDCVAIEVRYHRHCHLDYCRFLTRKSTTSKPTDELYQSSYIAFCSKIIDKRFIEEKQIMRMRVLHDIFVEQVMKFEKLDASNYRPTRLKARLQRDYPQLVFHRPATRNQSELVFVEELSVGEVAETCETVDTEEFESDSDDEMIAEASMDNSTMFALALKDAIKRAPAMNATWPPSSVDLSTDQVHKMVPILLFNFIAWTLGFSDYPTMSTRLELEESQLTKVMSICQDMLFIASNGRKQTPKSLGLGMAVRQLTRSSQLTQILNGFGHCSSHSAILTYETNLARLAIKSDCYIPKGAEKHKFTCLVYDNDDFSEDSRTQTHILGGILIQREESFDNQPAVVSQQLKKGGRTFQAPSEAMVPYSLGKKKTPSFLNTSVSSTIFETDDPLHQELARRLDIAYFVMKMLQNHYGTLLPGWTGFNILLRQSAIPPMSRIRYLPIIDGSPSEYSTLYTALLKSVDIADKLSLEHIVLVFDEAIYAKIQQIRWKDATFMKRFVVRLGEFHATMSFLSAIGNMFRDAGLQDILIESDVVGQGQIKGVLTGKHYNRSMHCHKVMSEALHRLRFQAFLDSLSSEDYNNVYSVASDLLNIFPDEKFQDSLTAEPFSHIVDKYEDFVVQESEGNPTFALWSTYLEMTGILLQFVRATREGNWELHLSTMRSMLTWYFGCDRVNYCRYGTAYWLEMTRLPDTHPAILGDLRQQWTVQRQQNHGFSSIACDMTIEQTLNRDSKTTGGMVGITLNRGAVQRWILSQSDRSAITRECMKMAGTDTVKRKRKELDMPQRTRHEKDVLGIVNTLQNMINPFETDNDITEMIHLSSCLVATQEVKNDLLTTKQRGEECVTAFLRDRLLVQEPDIFSTIPKLKLKTFSSMTKKVKVSSAKGVEATLKNNRNLFARMLLLAQSRNVDMKEVLTYSLGPFPLSLSTGMGTLHKTQKSKLMTSIESSVQDHIIDSLPAGNAVILDGMAIIQSTKKLPSSFGELAEQLFSRMINLAIYHKSSRVDFVVDRYPDVSIKNLERNKRASGGLAVINIYGAEQKLPTQWSKFLKHGRNKEDLVRFLFEQWSTYASFMFSGIVVYVCHDDKCHRLKPGIEGAPLTIREIATLSCDHEEADTRMLLHANHASQSYGNILIKSPDTDVFIIMLYFCHILQCELFFETGVNEKTRIINVRCVQQQIGEKEGKALVGFHAYTGCDSTSSFYGRSKISTWKLVSNDETALDTLARLGDDFTVDEGIQKNLESLTCMLYGAKETESVNEARYNLFRMGKFSDESLPPNEDCLL
ncbi:uncharacterized protein LOC114516648 isoform X2 [Dendronephthya gigantea]|uniref:uncharacterized protein LOC114516648 isoform X2 n=1 Tax=Dendronephthya gigantea TaxID=151771 RepID=UPI00106D11E9|nr:uncharacterized protein LOC114516648 isoform X2 [Dendronephthya gigantea]